MSYIIKKERIRGEAQAPLGPLGPLGPPGPLGPLGHLNFWGFCSFIDGQELSKMVMMRRFRPLCLGRLSSYLKR